MGAPPLTLAISDYEKAPTTYSIKKKPQYLKKRQPNNVKNNKESTLSVSKSAKIRSSLITSIPR